MQIPSVFAGIDIRGIPTIFLTRMDPSNSKEAIAFNNFSDAWRSKLRNVEAWIAVKLVPGPHLREKTVPKGKVFRNIVAWTGGALHIADISSCSNDSVAATPTHLPPPQIMLNMLNDLNRRITFLELENQRMKEEYEQLTEKLVKENQTSKFKDESLQEFQCEPGPRSR